MYNTSDGYNVPLLMVMHKCTVGNVSAHLKNKANAATKRKVHKAHHLRAVLLISRLLGF